MAGPGRSRSARSAGPGGSGQPQARRRQQQQAKGQQLSASRPGQRRWVRSPGKTQLGAFLPISARAHAQPCVE